MQRFAPAGTRRFARTFIDSLSTAPVERAGSMLAPQILQEPGTLDSLRILQRRLGEIGSIDSATIVGANVLVRSGSPGAQRDVSYEVYGSRGVALVHLRIIDEEPRYHVEGVRLERLRAPLHVLNGFRENLDFFRALVLAITIAIAVYTVWAAVVVAQTPMRRRWGWVLLALVGVGQFSVNWSTGATNIEIVNIQLLGGFLTRTGIVGPWSVGFAFPIGAILALRRRKRALAQDRVDVAVPTDTVRPEAESAPPPP